MSKELLGKYIKQVDVRAKNSNVEFTLDDISGISSIYKEFQNTKANLVDVTTDSYKVVSYHQFAYNPNTARMGDKIPIALNKEKKDVLVSSIYPVFSVDEQKIVPEYLLMWFKRSEFDRYARFKSHGSAREIFDWDEMCNIELDIPSIDEQKRKVNQYNVINNRINILRKINDNLLTQAKTYFGFVFDDHNDTIQLPKGWTKATVGDFCIDNVANLSKNDKYSTIAYLDTGNITENFIEELQKLDLLKDEIPSRAKRKASHGDIVYSTVRPNLLHYGLLQNPPQNLIVSTGFAVLHNKGTKVTNELLYMWLTKDSVLEYLQAIAENSVSTYPSLNVSDLLNIKIIIPDDMTLEKLNHFLTVIFSTIAKNNKHITILLNSRNIMLSKLILSC